MYEIKNNIFYDYIKQYDPDIECHIVGEVEYHLVNYSATSNRASCFNHYCIGYDIHNSASYTVSTGV